MGKKVVKVDDLRIVKIAGEFRVIAVETGKIVKFRRNGLEGLGKLLAKVFKEKFQEKLLCGKMLSL